MKMQVNVILNKIIMGDPNVNFVSVKQKNAPALKTKLLPEKKGGGGRETIVRIWLLLSNLAQTFLDGSGEILLLHTGQIIILTSKQFARI